MASSKPSAAPQPPAAPQSPAAPQLPARAGRGETTESMPDETPAAPCMRGPWTPERIRASMLLYAVTDRAWLGGRSLASCVGEALAGGATFVQLREKDAPREEVLALARELVALCRKAGAPFVVNDDVSVALEVAADGVHVGQSDTACCEARRLLGPDALVGVSVRSVAEARRAEADGADYIGVGALFGTATKADADIVSRDELAAIVRAVSIPVVGIGGLNLETLGVLRGTGAHGAAVVSALFAASDIRGAACALRRSLEEVVGAEGGCA